MRHLLVVTSLVLGALASAPAAQVGRPLPDASDLEDFTGIPAESYDDLVGRTVLIEFFAYW